MGSIYEFVKEQRDKYRTDTIEIADGYEFSQYQTLRTIELYHNSKFETGNKDTLGREKPFYNICKFRVNVAVRATDIDTKDISIESEQADGETEAFLLDLKNRNWMKQSNFPAFLNRFGFVRAKFGGVLVKKTEQKSQLAIHVMQWRNMITDQVDIRSGVKIERHYYTPAELQDMSASGWHNIDEAIATARKSQEAQAGKTAQKQNKTPGNYIEVFEVHGVLPDCYLTPKDGEELGSEHTYQRQMQVVVLDESDKDDVNGVSLFDGPEDARRLPAPGETRGPPRPKKVRGSLACRPRHWPKPFATLRFGPGRIRSGSRTVDKRRRPAGRRKPYHLDGDARARKAEPSSDTGISFTPAEAQALQDFLMGAFQTKSSCRDENITRSSFNSNAHRLRLYTAGSCPLALHRWVDRVCGVGTGLMGRPRVGCRWQIVSARVWLARLTRAAARQPDRSGHISNRFRLPYRIPPLAAVALALGLCGCSGSQFIDQYAADYRETVAAAGDAQLLLNILRAKDNLPIHFYDLSNIHGSIQLTAGANASVPIPLINAVTPSLLSPSIGAQNSPTFDLGTTDTQEFTRGLLSPLDPRVVKTLFDEGVDPRIMMLLFFSKYTDRHHRVLLNTMACDPANPGHHPERGCYNQVYDYLSEIDRLLAFADAEAGVRSPLQAKLMANTYVGLRPIGGALAGAWNLKDNFDQLRQLDTSQYKLIGKQLYRVSGLRLAICYESAQKQLHSLIPSQYPDAACTQNQIIDHHPMADENVGLSLRSTYDIIEFLGQVLRFQQEKGENTCLTLSKYERFCDTGEVLFQVNAPVGTPVIATRYGGASYALYDRGCDRNHQTPCDYSIQVLAILELLINENKAAKDIIATPRVQFVP